MTKPSVDPPRPAGPAARLSRLRIAGFKSFADPVELAILPGLTGIVGPNGCGKSNVADALRWAMGEGHARTLRGAEMDDVIFAGTATRPGHGHAEVSLTLEGDGLPAPFAGLPEVQVVRRIERGAGSAYRANGREVRARDVHALFADLASGARSSAMVSQGRVGALVGARPEERRLVLEEAAGIGGLQARRAEADAKLRAATANLARAEDAHGGLAAQLAGLRRQARQAERHRTLSARIGAAEAGLLALARARAAAVRTAAAAALATAQAGVVRAASAAATAEAEATAAAATLPVLREAATAAHIAAGQARLAQESRAAAAARAREALAAAAARRTQAAQDQAQAEAAAADAVGADARLAQEAQRLAEEDAASPARLAALQADAAGAACALQDAETASATAAKRRAALAAGAQALFEVLAQAEARVRRASDAAGRLRAERERAAQASVGPARLAAALAEAWATDAALAVARGHLDTAERAHALAAPAAITARAAQGRADAARIGLVAEIDALATMLAAGDGEGGPPITDQMQVPAGLEAALGAAVGEGLAAADPGAARHWRALPALPDRPLPGKALSALVQAPPALARALSGIGVVADDAAGEAGQPGLLPGQCLVSRAGAVWRWDGYTVRSGTPSAATLRLQQRSRLVGLRTRRATADVVAAEAQAACRAAEMVERAAAAAEAQARTAQSNAEACANRAGRAAAALQAQTDTAAAVLAGLDVQSAALTPEATAAAAALDQARTQRAGLPDPGQLGAAADQARAAWAAARAHDAAATRALEEATRDDTARQARRAVLAQERAEWSRRATEAARRVAELRARRAEAGQDHDRLCAEPAGTASQAEAAALLQQAEDADRAAAAALAAADRHAAATVQAARIADAALAQAREVWVRAEAASGQAEQAWAALPEAERPVHGATPAHPAADTLPDLSAGAEERARAELAALLRQCDVLGPVNQRATVEAAAVEAALQAATRERDELAAAIAALRGSLGQLDREARARLTAVFQQVDAESQALFGRMFGGGRAHLALVGSDDPLQAGLEIYAQPPGKRLSALSLLSGGEQALTALSLIFAVFRCNPAPVCVLDEVDAPLDDANVERLCGLLADLARDTATRFLVVTHHGLTMARMDRLYGVTMQERGVSRLLSVDLGQAAAWVEARAAE